MGLLRSSSVGVLPLVEGRAGLLRGAEEFEAAKDATCDLFLLLRHATCRQEERIGNVRKGGRGR